MAKRLIFIMALCSVLLLESCAGVVQTSGTAASETDDYPQLNEAALESNHYLGLYEDSKAEPVFQISPDFELAAENNKAALYVKPNTLAIRLLNKETGYIWSSNLDSYEEERLNSSWKAYFESGITIEYYEINAKTQAYKVIQESLTTDENTKVTLSYLENGFKAAVNFGESGIELTYRVVLTDGGIEVSLDPQDIQEHEPDAAEAKKESPKRLVSVTFFPFLGSTKAEGQDGYFIIPDGDGALVNFRGTYENIAAGYQKKYYGGDAGLKPDINNQEFILPPKALNYPLYGIVHGVRDNGLSVCIEEGDCNAELIMNPAGVRTDYYYITNRFIFREPYLHTVNSTTSSLVMQEAMTRVNIRMDIDLLGDGEADYLGIAIHYRNRLKERDRLPKAAVLKEVPILLDVLMSSVKPGIFFNKAVPMTTIGQLKDITSELKASGVERTIVSVAGMFKDAITVNAGDRFRLNRELGSLSELTSLSESMSAGGDLLAVEADCFAHSYKSYAGIKPKSDLIYTMDKNYSFYEHMIGLKKVKSIMLNSRGFEKYAAADAKKLSDLGIRGITVNLPFGSSSYGDDVISREASYEQIADTLQKEREQVGSVFIYQEQGTPQIIAGASGMKNIAMKTSLFPYITDSIPFTAIVYHGSIDLFSQTLNTIGDPDVRKLKMVEWGIYPAFDLTHEDPDKLLYSEDHYLVSSRYSDWKNEILETYSFVNGALQYVTGAAITDHRVLETGVVKVTYSNQVSIVVNYTEHVYQSDNLSIAAGSYEVIQP